MAGYGGKRIGAGRKKGSKATHTLEAEKAKEELIREYIKNIKPINEALIEKAKAGDIQAIKELHDRVYGRPNQSISGPNGGPIQLQGVEIKVRK